MNACKSISAIFVTLFLTFAAHAQDEAYTLSPDSQRQPGVPQGTVMKYAWEGKIYPNTKRDYYVYVPAQYDPKSPAALMVFQDGHAYLKEDGDFRVPIVFDNLIHKKEMPVTIGLFVNPGYWGDVPPENPFRAQNRSSEYDEVTDLYASFIISELVVELKKTYNISDDPKLHAICGLSSGGICAFTAAWFRPDYFHKVLSHIGSFTDIRGGHIYPALIRKSSKRDIKVFLQDGTGDLNNQFGNWWLANQQMASSLNFKGYDYQFVAGTGGHNGKHGGAIMPESLRWLWRDLPPIASKKYGWSELLAKKSTTGEERQHFEGQTRDLAEFEMQAFTLAPGKSIAGVASQQNEALLIVKSGELQVTVGVEMKPLGPGSVALILPEAKHNLQNATSSDATFFLLEYQPRQPMDAVRGNAAGGNLLVDWKQLPFKPHDKGGRRDFFDRPTAACSRYEMHVTNLNPGIKSHEPHTHRSAEMFVILEGSVELQIGDSFFQGGNGDVFYVESELPHAIRNVGKEQALYFAFQWE